MGILKQDSMTNEPPEDREIDGGYDCEDCHAPLMLPGRCISCEMAFEREWMKQQEEAS